MSAYIAYDCGGTRTRAGLYSAEITLIAETEGASTNPTECGVATCLARLGGMAERLPYREHVPLTVIAGVAGAFSQTVREQIAKGLGRMFPATRVIVTDDRYPLLFANCGARAGIVAIAGTGSTALAQGAEGERAAAGGRGTLFGDEGSAYHLAVSALRAAAHAEDSRGPSTMLTDAFMARLGCSDFVDVTRWAFGASKAHVAGLAPVVTAVAADGDGVACRCVDVEANILVDQVLAVKTRLNLDDQVAVYYHGGLIEGAAAYRAAFVKAARGAGLRGPVEPAPACGHGAVVALGNQPVLFADIADYRFEEPAPIRPAAEVKRPASPTEERLAGTPFLDECSAREIVRIMNQQDESVPAAVAAQEGPIAALIESVARAFAAEGRLIYVGAGTSGRLGVLDASECPPTFGVPPGRVVGLIAGGEKALRESVEGKEDDAVAALADLYGIEPAISHKDIVVGIAASGTTPYVRVILDEAHRLGITTGLVCCNPGCTDGADVVVAIHTGAEVLTGSTRLKAGTATKLVLNMITTGAMALSGLMYKGLMVGMRPVNAKLRRRAVGIVATLGNVDETVAAQLVEEAGYHIATAIIMARNNVDSATARSHLERAGGSLRAVLE